MIFTAKTHVSTLDAGACCSPLSAYEALSARSGGGGAVLMESAAKGSRDGTRSLVVPEGVVRLTVRDGRATYRALSPRGARLLPALSTVERVPGGAGEPSVPDRERLIAPSVFDAVRRLVRLVVDDESGAVPSPGVYGAFSFELVDQWESLPPRRPDPWNEPDINVVLALDSILYDHLAGKVHVVTRSLDRSEEVKARARHQRFVDTLERTFSPKCVPVSSAGDKVAEPDADTDDDEYLASVRKLLRDIEAGDVFQAVLSRGIMMRSDAHPLDVYRVLRERNPSPYMFLVDLGDGALLGASPETAVKVEAGRLEIRPIAGTARRGLRDDGTIDEELDARLAVGLLLDPKEQAEHAMLVDLARNDVARVSVPGTRRLIEPFTVEKYSHVQHLVSVVIGQMSPELDSLHAYRAVANMGTLTGAPKLRAMELIRETEPFSRGFYGGAVGYLLQDGTFDTCIVIRSLRYHPEGLYHTRAGAGIVADSVPELELQETVDKARACRQAVAMAEALT